MKNAIYYVLVFFSLNIHAQSKLAKKKFVADSLKIIERKSIRPKIKLDDKIIFFGSQRLGVIGIDAELFIKEKLRLTLGYYTISDKLTTIKKTIHNVTYQGQYALRYGSFNVEYLFKNKPLYAFGIPVELGLGSNHLNYLSGIANHLSDTKEGIILMTYVGLSICYKPLNWVCIKGTAGYRKTLYNQIRGLSFDGFYYSVGLGVDIGELIIDYKIYKLKKNYHKNIDPVETAVDILTH